MSEEKGFYILKEYNREFANYYSELSKRYKKIINYVSGLVDDNLKEKLKILIDKIKKNEDIEYDLDNLKNLIEEKFGRTPILQMPKREYNKDDKVNNKRKYDSSTFKEVAKNNFDCIDRELSSNCFQNACIYYLKMVYDLYGKLQDEIRFYKSFRNRTFFEKITSFTFGFISSIARSYNTYDSTAIAYENFCYYYLLPEYDILFGFNGICTKVNNLLLKVENIKNEYKNKENLIGKNNNTLIFEIEGNEHTITLGEIFLKNYDEFEKKFNLNNFGIEVNYCTEEDIIKYETTTKSFIFKSDKPFTFKKESTLLTLIGFEAFDTKSWKIDEKHIIFSRRNIKDKTELEKLRKLQLKILEDNKYFNDSITTIATILYNI